MPRPSSRPKKSWVALLAVPAGPGRPAFEDPGRLAVALVRQQREERAGDRHVLLALEATWPLSEEVSLADVGRHGRDAAERLVPAVRAHRLRVEERRRRDRAHGRMPDDVGDRELPHVSEREDRIPERVEAPRVVAREYAAVDVVRDLTRPGPARRLDLPRRGIPGGQDLVQERRRRRLGEVNAAAAQLQDVAERTLIERDV